MFTQQAQFLTSQYGRTPGAPVAGMLQTFANCAQPLETRGPVSLNGAANSRPPRGGVLTGPANAGGIGMAQALTGNNLDDYYAGYNASPFNQYPGTAWNNQWFSRTGNTEIYSGDGNYWGGDNFYGPTYLSGDTLASNRLFNQGMPGNYNYFNSAYDTSYNNQHNQNVSNWYSQQFIDQSFNDFSTHLNTTSNLYTQQINNFAGDNYFDNTITANYTFNNNVVNTGEVVNEGDVRMQGGFYIDAAKTYITNNNEVNTAINLIDFVAIVMAQVLVGGGGAPLQPQIRLGDNIDRRQFIRNFRDIVDVELVYDKAVGGTVKDDCTLDIRHEKVKAVVKPRRRARREVG
jgi:hypothetical protein